jgi:hypothetical protein
MVVVGEDLVGRWKLAYSRDGGREEGSSFHATIGKHVIPPFENRKPYT